MPSLKKLNAKAGTSYTRWKQVAGVLEMHQRIADGAAEGERQIDRGESVTYTAADLKRMIEEEESVPKLGEKWAVQLDNGLWKCLVWGETPTGPGWIEGPALYQTRAAALEEEPVTDQWPADARVDDNAIDDAVRERTGFAGYFDDSKSQYSAFAWAQIMHPSNDGSAGRVESFDAIPVAVEFERDPPWDYSKSNAWNNANLGPFKGYFMSGSDANALLESLAHWTGLVMEREKAIEAGGLVSPRELMGRGDGERWLGAADRLDLGVRLPASTDRWLTPAEAETLTAEVTEVKAEHERQRSSYTGPSRAEILRRHKEDPHAS